MPDNKIKIRVAELRDCKSVYDWRVDTQSAAMSRAVLTPSMEEHRMWFENSLSDGNRKLFIGELGAEKLGVCRFDFHNKVAAAEVSINMKPSVRGRGLGKRLLFECVEYYLVNHRHNLFAEVKRHNKASLTIFKSAGFEVSSSGDDIIMLKRDFADISFREVDERDEKILFELLARREHFISHINLPDKDEHKKFIKSNPYRYWAIVLEDSVPIGAVYVQMDNSIGLNLLKQKKHHVYRTLQHIKHNFKPLNEVKSKIPAYFYVNIPYTNNTLENILSELGALPIQVSLKV